MDVAMLYVISYDISVDRRRARVAKLLEGFGQRVQYSVFECDLTESQYAVLQRNLRRMLRATASEWPKHRQQRRFVERERCHLDHNMNRPRKTTCGAHSAGVYWNRGFKWLKSSGGDYY